MKAFQPLDRTAGDSSVKGTHQFERNSHQYERKTMAQSSRFLNEFGNRTEQSKAEEGSPYKVVLKNKFQQSVCGRHGHGSFSRNLAAGSPSFFNREGGPIVKNPKVLNKEKTEEEAIHSTYWDTVDPNTQRKRVQDIIWAALHHYKHSSVNNCNTAQNRLNRFFDTSFDGTVAIAGFRAGLARLHLNLTHDQTAELLHEFDPHNTGRINLHEFARALQDGAESGPGRQHPNAQESKAYIHQTGVTNEDIYERHHDALRRSVRSALEEHNATMRDAFLKMDTDRNRVISYQELQDRLHSVTHLILNDVDFKIIFDECDKEKTGGITFNQWVTWLGKADYSRSGLAVTTATGQIRKIENYDQTRNSTGRWGTGELHA